MKNFSAIVVLLVLASLSVLAQYDPPTLGSVSSPSLPNISSGYTASTLYFMNIKYTESTYSSRAFKIVISNPTNPGVIGTVVAADPRLVNVVTQGNNIIVTSTDTAGNVSWVFKWTTPASSETIEFETIALGVKTSGSSVTYTCTSHVSTTELSALSCTNNINNTNTSITELADKIDLNVYPNPISSFINVDYNLESNEEMVIELFDIIGKKIVTLLNRNQVAGSYSNQFELPSNLASGSYFISVKTGEVATFKQIMKL